MSTMYSAIVRISLVSGVLVSLLGGGITPASAQVLPPIITPSPGSTLTTTTVTFTGGHASQPGEEHWLSVGYGTRIWDNLIYHQSLGTGHTAQVSGLPSSGTLHVLYWTMTNAAGWNYRTHTYTMNVGSSGGGTATGGLAVFDADGDRVGPVVGTEDDGGPSRAVWFSFEFNNILVTLKVGVGGSDLFGMLDGRVFFESTNCSGPPLVERNNPGLWMSRFSAGGPNPGNGGGGDNIIYQPDPNASELNGGGVVMFGSSSSVRSSDCDSPSTGAAGNHVVPAQVVLDIDAVFTRPFHVQLDVAQ